MRGPAADVALGVVGIAIAGLIGYETVHNTPSDDLSHSAMAALPHPDDVRRAAVAAAASATEHDEDVRLYRESVAELEATAHAKYMTVAQLAESLGTDRDHLIGYAFALKKTRAAAEATDRAARNGPARDLP